MKATPEQFQIMLDDVQRCFNKLHNRDGLDVMEINMHVLGRITCSMEYELGSEQAREMIEDAMTNVWGPKPPKKMNRSVKIQLFVFGIIWLVIVAWGLWAFYPGNRP